MNSYLKENSYFNSDGFAVGPKDFSKFEKLKLVNFCRDKMPHLHRWCSVMEKISAKK